MITQARWRTVGAVAIGGAAIMAWFGVEWEPLRHSALLFCAYWGGFLLLFLASVYIAVLDIRYIRMQYAVERRNLFRQTIGEQEFRQSLSEAEHQARAECRSESGEDPRRN